jgi:acetyl/propionyl-CoA carboxylase alpha subunit
MKEVLKISGKKLDLPTQPKEKWEIVARPGGWWIAQSTSGVRKRFFLHESQGRFSAAIGEHRWFGSISLDLEGHQSSSSSGSDLDLVAQFPGKVRKILVQEGAEVGEGDPLILVEAMKMEFSIRAPFLGKIKRVLVKEGQQLSPGDRFVDLEALERDGE